jgi:hypothetical protein
MPEHSLTGAGYVKKYSGGMPSWIGGKINKSDTQINPFNRAYIAPSGISSQLSSGIGSMFLTSVASNPDLPLQYYSSPLSTLSLDDNSNRRANPNMAYMAQRIKDESDKDYNDASFSRTIKGEPSVSVYKVATNGRLPEMIQSNDRNDTIYAVRTAESSVKTPADTVILTNDMKARFGGTPK